MTVGFTPRRTGYSMPKFGSTLAEKFSATMSETLTSSNSALLASSLFRSSVMPILPVLTLLYDALRSNGRRPGSPFGYTPDVRGG